MEIKLEKIDKKKFILKAIVLLATIISVMYVLGACSIASGNVNYELEHRIFYTKEVENLIEFKSKSTGMYYESDAQYVFTYSTNEEENVVLIEFYGDKKSLSLNFIKDGLLEKNNNTYYNEFINE